MTGPAAAAAPRLALYLDLIRWDRPAGWLLLLWPTLSALWIAADGGGRPRALLRTTAVEVVRLGDVDAGHVRAETGGDDVAAWRRETEAAVREALGTEPDDATELVVEHVAVLYS